MDSPMRFVPLFLALTASLAGCVATTAPPPSQPRPQPVTPSVAPAFPDREMARSFVQVMQRVEPVAEAECRARAPRSNCDFKIVVDDRRNQPPNAFQTLDAQGRPVIVFTQSLIALARNADELAFVMGHEAAHHVAGHLQRQRDAATAGAVIFAGLATLTGADATAVRSATELGAAVGARSYSKEFELEADRLGTIIAKRSGFDPVRGAEFFNRIPDPGDRFLGTHPPNADRVRVVRETAARF